MNELILGLTIVVVLMLGTIIAVAYEEHQEKKNKK